MAKLTFIVCKTYSDYCQMDLTDEMLVNIT